MKRTRSLSHLAVAALLLALPVTALAKDYAVAGATATFIGKLKRSKHGTRASLTVRYRCRSGEVVWVSA
ncbi:MAG: hypothetical protein QOI80_1917, partial [Solirubrobacteraceae bacterium]|nr:hypothetical protein [Solirubrobacteraceae bacterium]